MWNDAIGRFVEGILSRKQDKTHHGDREARRRGENQANNKDHGAQAPSPVCGPWRKFSQPEKNFGNSRTHLINGLNEKDSRRGAPSRAGGHRNASRLVEVPVRSMAREAPSGSFDSALQGCQEEYILEALRSGRQSFSVYILFMRQAVIRRRRGAFGNFGDDGNFGNFGNCGNYCPLLPAPVTMGFTGCDNTR
jgi:hypothetical protein